MEFRYASETAISSENPPKAWLDYLNKATQRMRRGPYGLHRIFLPKRGHQVPAGLYQILTEGGLENSLPSSLGLITVSGRLKGKKWAGPVFIFNPAGQQPNLVFNSDWIGQVLAMEAAAIGDISLKITRLKELQESFSTAYTDKGLFDLEDWLWQEIIPRLKALMTVLQGVEISEKPFLYLHEIARYNKNLSRLTEGVIADSVFEGQACFMKGIMQLPEQPIEPLTLTRSLKAEPDVALAQEIKWLSAARVLDGFQKRAALNSLNHGKCYIQGPPGTGKTRTAALMILAALICRKKVVFVSSKKSAGTAVLDRLSELLKLNVQNEFPTLLGLKVTRVMEDSTDLGEGVPYERDLRTGLFNLLSSKRKVKQLKLKIDRLERILLTVENQIPKGLRPLGLKEAELIYGLLKRKTLTKAEALFIGKVLEALALKAGDDRALKLKVLKLNCFKALTIENLKKAKENLRLLPDLEKVNRLIRLNLKEWKKARHNRTITILKGLETELRQAVLQGTTPLFGCEIRGLTSLKADDYDLILADEATDIDLYQGLFLASKTKRLVLFGDHKQLGIEGLGLRSGLGKELDQWLWSEQGLENSSGWPRISKTSYIDWIRKDFRLGHSFLRNHYRCRKEIAAPLSAMFYEGLLKPVNNREYPFPALELNEYEGTRNPGKALVPEEATALLNQWELKLNSPGFDINHYGFVTYSKAQKTLITARAKKRGLPLPYLGTVEEWRGLEKKEIWVSPAIGEVPVSGPYHSPKRMAVIVSRASEKIVWFENSQRQSWPLFERWLKESERATGIT